MYVKDFIKQVASGYLCKDDILSYASNSYDKKELLWNLYLSDKEVDEDTGKPLITDDKGISRVDDAISFISKEFNVSLWDDSTDEPTADDSTDEPTAGDSTDEPTADDSTDEPTAGDSTDEPTAGDLPSELNTDEAKKYFEKAIEAGFMDKSYKFVGTWYQATYFAERAAEKLGLRHKWKPFQTLWGHDKLAQVKREIKERFGAVHAQKEIDKIFD